MSRTAGSHHQRELSWRSIVLGSLLTVVFTAANVYFGLRVGLTFSTAIPAAVISMAALRPFADSTIVENNITQTIASAAGAVATMIFVLPGLVMVGWWQSFPYWTTAAVCFVGGTLGVMMSVPLRRALVTGSDLPYPEGRAGAEVLRIGAGSAAGEAENRFGLLTIVAGALVAAAFGLLAATKLVAGEIGRYFPVGAGATGVSATLSLGLIGVGHLIGLSAGLAMGLGMALSSGVLLPWRTALAAMPAGPLEPAVTAVFASEVRFIGAGAIAVAAVWTLVTLVKPIVAGFRAIAAAGRERRSGSVLALTERDLPGWIVAGTVALSLLPIAGLLWRFAQGGPVATNFVPTLGLVLLYVLVVGAVVAAVTGYMAGLVGTSNSPVSGVGILAAIAVALLLRLLFPGDLSPSTTQALVAFALFAAAFVFGVALIANDNLQDLKTGQLVGSTPWKQQVALVIGVACGSLVVPPALNLLNRTFGFAGAPGVGPGALPAPQASLISSLVQGVLGGNLRWDLLGLGAAIGALAIVADALLARAGRLRLPPLALAMGMYLPISLILPSVVGAVLGHAWDRRAARRPQSGFLQRTGVLLATGIIVGDSLFGLAFAGLVGGLGENALVLAGAGWAGWSQGLGLAAFVVVIAGTYAGVWRAAGKAQAAGFEPSSSPSRD